MFAATDHCHASLLDPLGGGGGFLVMERTTVPEEYISEVFLEQPWLQQVCNKLS